MRALRTPLRVAPLEAPVRTSVRPARAAAPEPAVARGVWWLPTGLRGLDALAVAAGVGGALALAGGLRVAALVFGVGALALLLPRRVPVSLRGLGPLVPVVTGASVLAVVLLPWLGSDLALRLVVCCVVAVTGERAVTYAWLRRAHRRGRLLEPAVIVGAGETGLLLARLLAEHPEVGVRVLGFLDACPPSVPPPLPVLGTAAQLGGVVAERHVRRVLVAFPVEPDRDLLGSLRDCRAQGADVCVVPRFQELGTAVPRWSLDQLWGVPLVPLRRAPGVVARGTKRGIDVIVASALLVLLAPVLVVLAAGVRLRLGVSPLFRQSRVTRQGRVAAIYKLRTLPPHDDADTRWSVPQSGCTALGRWLRASHADELPQLVNVVRGEMSLVGPRPERPYFVDRFTASIPGYAERLRVPAGITGWAQVHGLHGDTSIAERVRLDVQYAETWSLWLDLVILGRTVALAARSAVGGRR